MTREVALRFHEVGMAYGPQVVLDRLSLEVESGEYFGLVGVNGAGKTTCIKGVLGLTEVDTGTIEIFGVDHDKTESRDRLAFLPERFLPPYYLTGRDFLRYMARLRGHGCEEQSVRAICLALDLDFGALAKSVRQYSKGMGQKLGLASCFLSNRSLLVMDEPMSGLDPKARLLVKRHLLSIKDGRHSVFISTHLLSDVEELCDRMGILHDGTLRYVGSPDECKRTFSADTLEQAYLACISTPA